jgi:hypothetical protein
MFHFAFAQGTTFDLLAGDLLRNSTRLHLQGTAALPSLRKGSTSIAVLLQITRAGIAQLVRH